MYECTYLFVLHDRHERLVVVVVVSDVSIIFRSTSHLQSQVQLILLGSDHVPMCLFLLMAVCHLLSYSVSPVVLQCVTCCLTDSSVLPVVLLMAVCYLLSY